MPGDSPRTPRKTELRAEVRLLCIELVAAGADPKVTEQISPTAKHDRTEFAMLLGNRTKVLPSQASGHGQVGPDLIVILEKETYDV